MKILQFNYINSMLQVGNTGHLKNAKIDGNTPSVFVWFISLRAALISASVLHEKQTQI